MEILKGGGRGDRPRAQYLYGGNDRFAFDTRGNGKMDPVQSPSFAFPAARKIVPRILVIKEGERESPSRRPDLSFRSLVPSPSLLDRH